MIDFGLVDAVDAEAIGAPGQRTFRVRARAGDTYAALWMEKEQLGALGRSFSQILAERSRLRGQPGDEVEAVGNFPQQANVEFQVARMGLDYDVDDELVILLADDPQAGARGDTPAFRMQLTRSQALAVIKLIEEIVTSGRPLCPLCHQALDHEGQEHFCPQTNGHSKDLDVPPLDVEDDEEEFDDDDDEIEDDDN